MKGQKKRLQSLTHSARDMCWYSLMLNHLIAKFISYFYLCRMHELKNSVHDVQHWRIAEQAGIDLDTHRGWMGLMGIRTHA